MKRFDHVSTAPAPTPALPAEQPKLARAPAANRDVLMRAIVSASVAWNLLASLCVTVFAVSSTQAAPVVRALAVGWLLFALFLAVFWRTELGWIRKVIWEAEVRTGVDLNRDGRLGKPGSLAVIGAARTQQELENEENEELLSGFFSFVAGCLASTDTEATREDRWVPPLDRDTYIIFRDALLSGGYARWKGNRHNSGWVFYPGQTVDGIMQKSLHDRPALLQRLTKRLPVQK